MTDAKHARGLAAWQIKNPDKRIYWAPKRWDFCKTDYFCAYLYDPAWDEQGAEVTAIRLCLAADVMETL